MQLHPVLLSLLRTSNRCRPRMRPVNSQIMPLMALQQRGTRVQIYEVEIQHNHSFGPTRMLMPISQTRHTEINKALDSRIESVNHQAPSQRSRHNNYSNLMIHFWDTSVPSSACTCSRGRHQNCFKRHSNLSPRVRQCFRLSMLFGNAT